MYAKKNSGKKIIVTLLAIVLLIGCTIGGTLAWLTATSGTVTNTFTVGDINITLQEYPFKTDSTTELDESATPVQSIDTYKVVPGGEQPKKPFVTVKAKSENCYVYVNVVNNLTIDKTLVVNYDTPANWTQIATQTAADGTVSTLYRYNSIMNYSENDSEPLVVFTKVTYSNSIQKDSETDLEIGQLKDKTIVLKAYAHQSDNTTQAVADAAAKAQFGYSA